MAAVEEQRPNLTWLFFGWSGRLSRAPFALGWAFWLMLLSAALARAPERFGELEAIIHPLVRAREIAFVEAERRKGFPLVLLDIPLLYEAGGESRVDKVAVVTCDPQTQRRRVLERPGMTEEKFALILSRQMPDAEKRQRADFVIDTGQGLEAARKQVEEIIAKLTERRN